MIRRGPPYWFPMKRYGWGWGVPNSWQGWVVLGVYIAAMPIGIVLFPPWSALVEYMIYVHVLTLALIFICWMKGEPPRWRWRK